MHTIGKVYSSKAIVFKLQHGHFYVECGKLLYGYSVGHEMQKEMAEHRKQWLHDYPIVCVDNVYQCKYPMSESIIVKRYMQKYGISNVRGGMYYDYVFDKDTYMSLHREIFGGAKFDIGNGSESDCEYKHVDHFENNSWLQMLFGRIIKKFTFGVF